MGLHSVIEGEPIALASDHLARDPSGLLGKIAAGARYVCDKATGKITATFVMDGDTFNALASWSACQDDLVGGGTWRSTAL